MPSLARFVNQGSLFDGNSQAFRFERTARRLGRPSKKFRNLGNPDFGMQIVGLENAMKGLGEVAPASLRAARAGIKEGLEEFKDEARREIRGWRTRSDYTRTGETARSVRLGVARRGAYIAFGGVKNRKRQTADGRPIYVAGRLHELGGRHPVFARQEVPRERWDWASQPRRPVLLPLAKRGGARAKSLVQKHVVDELGRAYG